MEDKTFTVSHARSRMPLTIKGKNLKDALEKEGLNPDIWKPIVPIKPEPEAPLGKDN